MGPYKVSESVLSALPQDLVTSIIKRVASDGFRHLGQLLASGREGNLLALNEDVLKEVSLKELEENTRLVNRSSIYRPFFMRCVHVENPTACYLESLRLACRAGKSDEAMILLKKVIKVSDEALFLLGLVLICTGQYNDGVDTMTTFRNRIGSHAAAEATSEKVFRQISQLGCLKRGFYLSTWRFFNVPVCVGIIDGCGEERRCPECFVWTNSIEFMCLC